MLTPVMVHVSQKHKRLKDTYFEGGKKENMIMHILCRQVGSQTAQYLLSLHLQPGQQVYSTSWSSTIDRTP